MIPLIVGAASTAAALYTTMSTCEAVCEKADDYIDKNVDIWTAEPVLGFSEKMIRCRSKSERKIIKKYNKLFMRLLNVPKKKRQLKNLKLSEEQTKLMFRLGLAFESLWAFGYSGQKLQGFDHVDPRAVKTYKDLSTDDKFIIARAHALLSARRGKGKRS